MVCNQQNLRRLRLVLKMEVAAVKNFVNRWQVVSLILAVILVPIIILSPLEFTQKILLSLIVCILLHFFEEFGFPGGFPYVGVKVLLNSNETNPRKWGANNLNSLFGNWGFMLLIYVVPLVITEIKFLTLAAILFSFLEIFMHAILFNVKLRTLYNPGLFTALFGMIPISIFYFYETYGQGLYDISDYIFAFVWCMAVFRFCFRSPLYWKLGKLPGYPFTKRSALGLYAN